MSRRVLHPLAGGPLSRARSRGVGAGVVAVAMVTLAAGCGNSGSPSGTATGAGGVKLVAAGKLTTCTHLPYAPFQSNEGGKVVGFDIDMIDLVAKKLGVTQTVVDTPFEGIKSGQDLDTGKCDIAAAGMTITPERLKVIDFSVPYFDATLALLIRKGGGYTSLESFKGKNLGVQSGTTGKDFVISKKIADLTPKEYEDLATLQQALATNQIDGAVNDLPVWSDYIKKNPGKFEVAAQFNTADKFGFGIKKGGNPELLKAVDGVITAARSDGTYATIYEKWFGTKPAS